MSIRSELVYMYGMPGHSYETPRTTRLCDSVSKPRREWISIKERLPDIGIPVLIVTSYKKMATASCTDHEKNSWGWLDWMRPQHSYGSVTHWMPLPAPPEET
jgi:hypothetical protein